MITILLNDDWWVLQIVNVVLTDRLSTTITHVPTYLSIGYSKALMVATSSYKPTHCQTITANIKLFWAYVFKYALKLYSFKILNITEPRSQLSLLMAS